MKRKTYNQIKTGVSEILEIIYLDSQAMYKNRDSIEIQWAIIFCNFLALKSDDTHTMKDLINRASEYLEIEQIKPKKGREIINVLIEGGAPIKSYTSRGYQWIK